MVDAAHQPPTGGADPGSTEGGFRARSRIGLRTALVELAASVGVLLREIRYAGEIRYPAEIKHGGQIKRANGLRPGGADQRLRPASPAGNPLIFEKSGPPQGWLDYVAAHDPVWIGDHDTATDEPLTEPPQQPKRGPAPAVRGWPPDLVLHGPEAVAPAPERPGRFRRRIQRLTDQLATAVVTRRGAAAPSLHEPSNQAQGSAEEADVAVQPARELRPGVDPAPPIENRPTGLRFRAAGARRLVPILDPSLDPVTVDPVTVGTVTVETVTVERENRPALAPSSRSAVSRRRTGAPHLLPSDAPISPTEVESRSHHRNDIARFDGADHVDHVDRGHRVGHGPRVVDQVEPVAKKEPLRRPTRPIDHTGSLTADHEWDQPRKCQDEQSQARRTAPPRRRAEVEELTDRWPSLFEPQTQTEDAATESAGAVSSIWRGLERDELDPTITQQRRR